MAGLWRLLLVATAAVVVGTFLGTRLLTRLPQRVFRRIIAVLLLILGVSMVIVGSA
jgi:uncharacterized membrane protein YfcA